MKNILAKLGENELYDTSRVFFTGCSMGSAESFYQATCLKSELGNDLTAFATHSTGVKIKGDGLRFPPDIYDTSY